MPTVPNSTITFEEYPYGQHPLHKLDVFLPNQGKRLGRRTVVLVHGGGFARGDKRRSTLLFIHLRDLLLANNYNVVMPNYRLAADMLTAPPQHAGDDKYPAAPEDVAAAMLWMRDNRARIGVSWPAAMIGESAGGTLAAAIAYDERFAVRALMTIGGFADLPAATSPVLIELLENYLGCTLAKCPDLWKAASPALNVTKGLPLLVWHGALDDVVDHAQAFLLAIANSRESGESDAPPSTVQLIAGAGHTGLAGFASQRRDAEVIAFLAEHHAGAVS